MVHRVWVTVTVKVLFCPASLNTVSGSDHGGWATGCVFREKKCELHQEIFLMEYYYTVE